MSDCFTQACMSCFVQNYAISFALYRSPMSSSVFLWNNTSLINSVQHWLRLTVTRIWPRVAKRAFSKKPFLTVVKLNFSHHDLSLFSQIKKRVLLFIKTALVSVTSSWCKFEKVHTMIKSCPIHFLSMLLHILNNVNTEKHIKQNKDFLCSLWDVTDSFSYSKL